jgi:hypothetical protein
VAVISVIVGVTICVWQVKKSREKAEQMESIKHIEEPGKMDSFLSRFTSGITLRSKTDSSSYSGTLKPKKTSGSISKDSQRTFVAEDSRISFGPV